jgi:peptidoglycan/xylan/chitin deacetylase (PgdA/CDA1 family)
MNPLKHICLSFLVKLKIDSLFRYLNRQKLVIVMYHGVSRGTHHPPLWTQLPQSQFRRQLLFLKAHYNFLSLPDFIDILRFKKDFPPRSALLTFDDGLQNNYTVAYPVLKELQIPAAIFLTINFIDTSKMFWFDELFLILREALQRGSELPHFPGSPQPSNGIEQLPSIYSYIVQEMKHLSSADRNAWLDQLRALSDVNLSDHMEDFGMLTWDQVFEMRASGLVDFGVHTASHAILSHLAISEWEKEMLQPRLQLSAKLQEEIVSFCYPNGRPGLDFSSQHQDFLKEHGYVCAFSTQSDLYGSTMDRYQIGRIPVGHDLTSELKYFSLNCSGALNLLRRFSSPIC